MRLIAINRCPALIFTPSVFAIYTFIPFKSLESVRFFVSEKNYYYFMQKEPIK